jgi:hypothetical protein
MASKASGLGGQVAPPSGAPSAPTGQGPNPTGLNQQSPRLGGLQLNDVTIVADDVLLPLPGIGLDDDDLSSTENEDGDFKRKESEVGFSRRPFGPDGTPVAARQPPALPSADGGGSGALALRRRETEIESSSDDEKDDLKQGAAPSGGLGSGLAGGHRQPAPAPGGIRPIHLIRGGAGGKGRASSASQPNRVRTVQASDARNWSGEGMLAGTMVGLAVGAVVTGVTVATGGVAAAFGGLILFGAMLAGGGAGWSIPSFLGGRRQQKTHLDAALHSLDRAGERFTHVEANRLAEVTDVQWRTLLHVPRSNIADAAGRRELREDLVLLVAKHGFKQTAAARDLLSRHVPGSEATDRAGPRELREDVVDLAAEHGYAQTAAALDLLHVPRTEMVANPVNPRTTRRIEIDRDARREIRQDLVLLVAKYGYQQTAAARDLLNVPRSQEVPGLERRTTRRIEIDRAGRQMLREHLVFNVARHGHTRTAAEKPALERMVAVGTLRGGSADLDTLRRSVRGPGGETLYGPYDGDFEEEVAEGFRAKLPSHFERLPGGLELSEQCWNDVSRDMNPHLVTRDGREVRLQHGLTLGDDAKWSDMPKIAATLAAYVGDRKGDQAAVVKHLSAYLSQGPEIALNLRTQRLYPVAGEHTHDPHHGEYTHIIFFAESDIKRDRRPDDIKVEEDPGGESYVLSYHVHGRIREVMSMEDSRKHAAHGHVEAFVAIRVQRKDLAAGDRNFEWVQRPHYDLQMTMGPAPPGSGRGAPDNEARS